MKKTYLKLLVVGSMMLALAFLLTLLSFPLPFFPPWLKLDFAEVPILIVALYCAGLLCGMFGAGKERRFAGLWAALFAVALALLKNLINILIKGPSFGGVGELANFLMAAALCVPAVLTYSVRPSLKHAVIGAVCGALISSAVAMISNLYLLLPAAGISAEALSGVMSPIFSLVGYKGDALLGYAFLAVLPFNIIKMSLECVIGVFVYQRLVPVLGKSA